jgi:RHS repeat-associated protein
LTLRDGCFATKNIFAGNTRVAVRLDPDDDGDGNVLYFHDDHLGSTNFLTDSQQNLQSHEEYFPSGELWVDETFDQQHTQVPYLFTGKELDTETGLYYFGARYYDPRLSVWVSPDPILNSYVQGVPNRGVELPQNLGLYTYSWNNPVVVRDPNGECPLCITAAAGAGIGALAGSAVYGVRAWQSGEFSWRGLAGSALSGAITGGVAGLTGGASLLAQVGTGAGAGVVAGIANRAIEGKGDTFDPKAMATDAVVGGVTAGIAVGVAKGVSVITSAGARGGVQGTAETVSQGASKQVVKEGIYEFQATSGKTYVGQSGNIPRRLVQHVRSGKLPQGGAVKVTEVLGGKTTREIAEQTRINELGGIKNLENKVNPIGPNRQHLMRTSK